MSISSPSLPSSFDPDLHLRSEPDLPSPRLAPSNSNSDDLEAMHIQEEELRAARLHTGAVIRHRSSGLPGTLRREDILNPETPSKHLAITRQLLAGSDPPVLKATMPFSSSPVLYPLSSSPPAIGQKRKLFQTWRPEVPKKRKMLGGFIVDEEDEEDLTLVAAKQQPSAQAIVETASDSVAAGGPGLDLEQVASRSRSPSLPPLTHPETQDRMRHSVTIQTSSGKFVNITIRPKAKQLSYEQTIAQRSTTAPGRARKAYYGIDIHKLLDENKAALELENAHRKLDHRDTLVKSVEHPVADVSNNNSRKCQMWTEKYRARKFTDLIGDERTHRSVLRWLKSWDPIVFPGSTKSKVKKKQSFAFADPRVLDERSQHRKILLLTGPPGLGKTTLAHVCARQAGYETLEINASDERSRNVVTGRIRDAVGTENVRGIDVVKGDKKTRKAGRPVCVVVDEVDGVVSGSGAGGGDGGFMKALVDLVQLDQRSSQYRADTSYGSKKTKKGDNFRLLRPLILVCNDLYAPALRPLRTSSCAEIIHVRTPPIDKAINRLTTIFEKEHISSDVDAVRRLCEASWGLQNRKQGHNHSGGASEGDIRSLLVQGEWIAHKLRSSTHHATTPLHLTKSWLEENILNSTTHSSETLNRGGIHELIDLIFTEGAGLPNVPFNRSTTSTTQSTIAPPSSPPKTAAPPIGISELRKNFAVTHIRALSDTLSDPDRLTTSLFTTYPTQIYQDDTYLSKPAQAYDWLHFHDTLSSRVFAGQEWELSPYLSTGVCAFHCLFASTAAAKRGSWEGGGGDGGVAAGEKDGHGHATHPFAGPRADFMAYEAEKANRALITELQSHFAAPLLRLYRSMDAVAVEMIPNVARMLAPEVKPVLVGGGSAGQGSTASVRKESEKACVRIGSRVMSGVGVGFERVRVEGEGGERGFGHGHGHGHGQGGFVMRMEP